MFARVATFEGGDVERIRQLRDEQMSGGAPAPPPSVRRVMVLQGDRRMFITFFDSREDIEAAEEHFERMGDEIPEEVRGKRVGVDVYEVLFDGEP